MRDPQFYVDYWNQLFPDARCELNYRNHYELLIAVILSAQTTDKKVNAVTEVLFQKYPDFNSLKDALFADVESIIHPLGLSKSKTSNIINTAKIIDLKYHGKKPEEKKEIKTLPGVGEKVAAVYLGDACLLPEFPVDTHVFRIAKRLELAKSNDPEKVSEELKQLFAGYDYMKLHHQIIFFGRYFCQAKTPNCKNCLIQCSFSKEKKQK